MLTDLVQLMRAMVPVLSVALLFHQCLAVRGQTQYVVEANAVLVTNVSSGGIYYSLADTCVPTEPIGGTILHEVYNCTTQTQTVYSALDSTCTGTANPSPGRLPFTAASGMRFECVRLNVTNGKFITRHEIDLTASSPQPDAVCGTSNTVLTATHMSGACSNYSENALGIGQTRIIAAGSQAVCTGGTPDPSISVRIALFPTLSCGDGLQITPSNSQVTPATCHACSSGPSCFLRYTCRDLKVCGIATNGTFFPASGRFLVWHVPSGSVQSIRAQQRDLALETGVFCAGGATPSPTQLAAITPTDSPSLAPTTLLTTAPSVTPTTQPSTSPTPVLTTAPSAAPTARPSASPTGGRSLSRTGAPNVGNAATPSPTAAPSAGSVNGEGGSSSSPVLIVIIVCVTLGLLLAAAAYNRSRRHTPGHSSASRTSKHEEVGTLTNPIPTAPAWAPTVVPTPSPPLLPGTASKVPANNDGAYEEPFGFAEYAVFNDLPTNVKATPATGQSGQQQSGSITQLDAELYVVSSKPASLYHSAGTGSTENDYAVPSEPRYEIPVVENPLYTKTH